MEQYEDELTKCPYCGYEEGTQPEQALHMEPGSILHDRFIVGKSIGYGGFGVTYIGWDALLEQKVAIKEYLPIEFSIRRLLALQEEQKENRGLRGCCYNREYEGNICVNEISGLINLNMSHQRLEAFWKRMRSAGSDSMISGTPALL